MGKSSIRCFLVEPTTRYRVNLRRYNKDLKCPANGWCHNTDVFIGTREVPGEHPPIGDTFPHDDPRWPQKCDFCDYRFVETDEWQENHDCLWVAPDGKTYTLISPDQMTNDKAFAAPPGAMWRATWLEPSCGVGPDGRSYVVRTPDGDWHIDGGYGTAPRNGVWTRIGDAPNFTVTPSIMLGKYHGWLKSGRLEEC